MVAKYAKLERVDRLAANFQQAPLVQNFWNFHNIVIEHQKIKISEEKEKLFFNKKNPKIKFTMETA